MSQTFEDVRPLLFSLAYRMLGSAADAEDIVQDAFIRYEQADDVEHPKAYLSKVVTRLCIDHLRSARVRRESYVGTWLPEPLLTDSTPDVSEEVEQSDSLSLAFLVMLETLSPVERAVFLLREVFGYEYDEIGETVGKSADNCRQIAHRAKRHIEARRPRFKPEKERRDELLGAFFVACGQGDLESLMELLAEDVTLWSDGGGKVKAARRPIEGRAKVARFLLGILAKEKRVLDIQVAEVNGSPGFVVFDGGRPRTVAALEMTQDGIQGVHLVVNPDKLKRLMPRTSEARATFRL